MVKSERKNQYSFIFTAFLVCYNELRFATEANNLRQGVVMTHTKEIGRILEICRETAELMIGEETVSYRLIKLDMEDPMFVLTIKGSEDKAEMIVGSDEAEAKALLKLLVDGKASPCNAADIFRDIIL